MDTRGILQRVVLARGIAVAQRTLLAGKTVVTRKSAGERRTVISVRRAGSERSAEALRGVVLRKPVVAISPLATRMIAAALIVFSLLQLPVALPGEIVSETRGLTPDVPSPEARVGTAGPVINEVFYDPEGSDTGWEFVELFNAGTEPVCLGSWSLLAGDGARPGSWKTIWQGAAGDTLWPGRIFLIAGTQVAGADGVAELGLQNGPDCCALACAGEHSDIVGWGDHEHSEYYEGHPASDVPSGYSLARWPDGIDSDDNSADFVECFNPTPGRRNALEKDLTFGLVPLETYPINPEVHDRVTVRATVVNAGLGVGRSDQFTVLFRTEKLDGGSPPLEMAIPSSLAPGDTAVLDAAWDPPSEGGFRAEASLVFDGDQDTTGNRAVALLRVGTGPAVINEIMYDPNGGGEWIEIFNRTSDYLDMGGWSLVDKAAGRLTLPGHAQLPPGGYAVVAQDSVDFVEFFRRVRPDSVVGSYGGRWPSLNNSDGADGVADVLTLTDAGGLLSDRAVYSERLGAGAGLSLERVRADLVGGRSDNWSPSGGPEGATPGGPNTVRAGVGPGSGVLRIDPNLIDTRGGAGAASLNYSLPFRPSRLTLSVYSMNGREVTRLMDRVGGPSKGTVLWDGRGVGGQILELGAYVILLVADAEDGRSSTAKAVAVLR